MQNSLRKREYLPFILGFVLYGITVVWINFHASQWYNFDMYADASFARRMAEQNTFFPENWIFGNQYYIIAAPAVASVFFRICHDSVLAMSCAVTLMCFLILLCYAWCCRPVFSGRAFWAGLFCMAGATIVGDSISSSTYGFQVLYTMAGYYSCYLLVILLHLGMWMRLRKGNKGSPVLVVVAITASFALGIQSPREMLSLCIPLFLLTLAEWLGNKKDSGMKKSMMFAASSLILNLLGLCVYAYAKENWGSRYASNVTSAGTGLTSGAVLNNLHESANAFLEMVGLRYLSYSWKWKPLAVMGVFLLILALCALVLCLQKEKRFKAKPLILFCWISMLGVFMAGVFLIQIRAIYFFVWYLLVPLSVSVLCETLPERRKALFCAAVLLFGSMSYFYNVYPDISRYRDQKQFYSEIVSWLDEHDVKTVYGDYQAPTVAACSRDRIAFCSVFPNGNAEAKEGRGLLIPYGSPVATEAYRNVEPSQSMLILSDSPYDEMSGFRYLNGRMSDIYREGFEEQFECETSFTSPYVTYYVYSFSNPDIFP